MLRADRTGPQHIDKKAKNRLTLLFVMITIKKNQSNARDGAVPPLDKELK
jgi:hypothetical protein